MSRWRTVLMMVGAAFALGACGIAEQGAPQDIDATKVNVDLASPVAAPVAEGLTGPKVYFLGPDRSSGSEVLRQAGRDVPANDTTALLEALLEGLTQTERDKGWTTWIPAGTTLRQPLSLQTDGTVVIDLSRAFFGVQSDSQKKAVAQIVYTVTGADGVKGVRLLIEGQRTPLPVRDGRLSDELLDRNDYRDLDPTAYNDLPRPGGVVVTTTTTPVQTTVAPSTTAARPGTTTSAVPWAPATTAAPH
jgi:hypothetical protein